jgi:hypothetical protein
MARIAKLLYRAGACYEPKCEADGAIAARNGRRNSGVSEIIVNSRVIESARSWKRRIGAAVNGDYRRRRAAARSETGSKLIGLPISMAIVLASIVAANGSAWRRVSSAGRRRPYCGLETSLAIDAREARFNAGGAVGKQK